jgi:pyruvate dehydrogenase E1 component beta subunit
MLKTAIRDDNPVIFLEGEMMYAWTGDVPEGEYLIPFGEADIKRSGDDISLITYGKPLKMVTEVAEKLAEQGIAAEIVDLRSLRPLDEETIYASVRKTNRALIIEESWPVASVGAYVGWLIGKHCFDDLDAPVEMVASEDVPMPYNHKLELAAQPSVAKIEQAAKRLLYLED